MQSTDASREWGRVTLQPSELVVGQYVTWKVQYIVGRRPIEQGGDIRIRPYGNPLVRPPGQTTMPGEDNYVTVNSPSDATVEIECTEWLVVTVTLRDGQLVEGDEITVVYGDRSTGSPGFKLRAVAHDLRFRLSVKPCAGEEPIALPERPLLRLVPDQPSRILAKASSVLSADEDVALMLRCVDRFGNTTPKCHTSLHIPPIQGLVMPDEVKLQSDKGSYRRVRCQRVGENPAKRIRIAVRNNAGELVARSNPVEINASQAEDRIFWGDLHCHSNLEQGLESLEFIYEYARDQEKLDFIAHVEHYSAAKTRWTGKHYKTWRGGLPSVAAYNEDTWEYRKQLLNRYYEPGRFVTLLGHEWASNIYGHQNVYFPGDDGPLLYPSSSWDKDSETPTKLWHALSGHDAIIVPHHTSAPIGTGKPPDFWALSGYDWDYYEPNLVRLVEIYSKHGSAEHFGCPRAPFNQQEDGTVRAALARGYNLGFVAASDTHASRPGSDLFQDHTYSQSGLTAIFAQKLDRMAIYQALKARRCYATTGQRIILRFWLNEHFMGDTVLLNDPGELKDLSVEVATEDQIEWVEVIKNGMPFYKYSGHLTPGLGWWRDNGWEMKVRVLDRKLTKGTDYYYVRVTQQNGGMAWSSPIWVSVG
jgi:hypothetical protein